MSGGANNQMSPMSPGTAGLPAGNFDGTSGTAGLFSGADMQGMSAGLDDATEAALAHPNGAGSTAQAAMQNMPQWQKGLMGLVTGDAKFGQNAPAMNALMAKGLGMATQGGMQGKPNPPMPPMGAMPPTPMNTPPPGIAARPMSPQPMQAGSPIGGGMGMQGGMQSGQLSPQLLMQLRQQYPQLFAQQPLGQ